MMKSFDDSSIRLLSENKRSIENTNYRLIVEKTIVGFHLEVYSLRENISLLTMDAVKEIAGKIDSVVKDYFSPDDLNLLRLKDIGIYSQNKDLEHYSGIEQLYSWTPTNISFSSNKLVVENENVLLYITRKNSTEYLIEGIEFAKSSSDVIQKSFKLHQHLLHYIYRFGLSQENLLLIEKNLLSYFIDGR